MDRCARGWCWTCPTHVHAFLRPPLACRRPVRTKCRPDEPAPGGIAAAAAAAGIQAAIRAAAGWPLRRKKVRARRAGRLAARAGRAAQAAQQESEEEESEGSEDEAWPPPGMPAWADSAFWRERARALGPKVGAAQRRLDVLRELLAEAEETYRGLLDQRATAFLLGARATVAEAAAAAAAPAAAAAAPAAAAESESESEEEGAQEEGAEEPPRVMKYLRKSTGGKAPRYDE